MNESVAGRFTCESCGRSFSWKPPLAGKNVKCPCGQVMTVPMDDGELYAFAEEPQIKSPLPKPNSPMINRVVPIEYHQPTTARHSKSDESFPDRVKDLYMPLWLIGGSILIEFGYAALFSRQPNGMISAVLGIGMNMTLNAAAMLVGIFIVGKIRQINFGSLPVAILKLCAIAIAPGAIAILIAPIFLFIPLGPLLIAAVQFVIYFALLGALFDLDESDTWYCVCVLFLINLAIYFAWQWM